MPPHIMIKLLQIKEKSILKSVREKQTHFIQENMDSKMVDFSTETTEARGSENFKPLKEKTCQPGIQHPVKISLRNKVLIMRFR